MWKKPDLLLNENQAESRARHSLRGRPPHPQVLPLLLAAPQKAEGMACKLLRPTAPREAPPAAPQDSQVWFIFIKQ